MVEHQVIRYQKGVENSTLGLEFPLLLQKYCGLSDKTKMTRKIFFVAYNVVFIFILILITVQLCNTNGNITQFAWNLQALCAFSQYLGKIYCLYIFGKNIRLIVDATKLFSPIPTHSGKFARKLLHLQTGNDKLQKTYIIICLIGIGAHVLPAAFKTDLILGTWNIKNQEVLRNVLVISESAVLFPSGFAIIFLDTIFVGFCIKLAIQFRLLANRIDQFIITDTTQEDLVELLKQQIFLLGLLKKLTVIYSPVIAIQYLTVTPVICVEMYVLSDSDDVFIIIKQGIMAIAGLLQLSFYILTADYLINEAMQFAHSLYGMNWENSCNLNKWKLLPFYIHNSQNPPTFSACGLVVVDTPALLKVIKVAWSACAVLRAMKK